MSSVFENLSQLIERGGIVMIPLLALSMIALALIIERSWFWIATNRPARVRRIIRIIRLVASRDDRARRALLGDGSVYGRVYRDIIDSEHSDSAALAAVESERPRMERFMTTLSTIITGAPLLGILGTVLGIIHSFDLLGSEQTLSDPRAVSGGIAEALLTTALGLLIALVTLFPYMIFRGQVDRTLGRLEALVAAAREAAAPETRKAADRTKQQSGA